MTTITADITAAALAALADAGLLVDAITFDGKLHRVATSDRPKGKNGAYIAHGDAPISIWWQNWRTGESGTWTAKGQDKLTASEKAALARRMEENRKARDAETARIQKVAARKAQTIYTAATECTEHPYLTVKGVQAVSGLKVTADGKLMVPAWSEHDGITTIQFIGADGEKRFLAGGKKSGSYFLVGQLPSAMAGDIGTPVLVAEGLATALSLHECLGLAVFTAFDAGNIPLVAKMARARHPGRKIIICADNDIKEDGSANVGVDAARAAALAVDGFLAVPRHEGRALDWNDLHQAQGADEVRRQFQNQEQPTADGSDSSDTSDSAPESEPASRILPAPPPVPLEAFPAPVAALLEEAAEAFTVPLQIPTACVLGVLSCLVGGTRLISLRPSWKEPGNIWIAPVAASGIGKTPCAAAFFRPIKSLEYEAFQQWRDAYASYENELELVRKERAKAKRGERLADRPLQPKRRQAYIDDATVEALGEVLSENPRGIMWRKDELAGLVADLDKYSSGTGGGTRSRLLSSYDGQEWKTSRTSNPTRNVYIPRAYVGIFGGIQPAMLSRVFEAGASGVDEASGFLQRFILIRAERDKPGNWTDRYLSQSSKDLLSSIVAALWAWDIEYDGDGREVEKIVPVSHQAKRLYVEWFNGIAQEEFLSQNAALLSKLKGQAQRLCLLLHSLDAALTGTDGMNLVTEDTMRRALLLADWVKEHQEQCWRFFTPEKGARQADPIERGIMAVVVEEAARIEADGWRISNADLAALVEKHLNMPGLPKVKIGKAASGLGLPTCSVNKGDRGRIVTSEKIAEFRATVGTVGTVGKHCAPRGKSADSTVGQPSATVGGNLPTWAQPTDADSTPTVGCQSEPIAPQGLPTHPTVPTVVSEDTPVFDFNDPAFPDERDFNEVKI